MNVNNTLDDRSGKRTGLLVDEVRLTRDSTWPRIGN